MGMFDVVGHDWSMLVGGVVVWDRCVTGTRWSTHVSVRAGTSNVRLLHTITAASGDGCDRITASGDVLKSL